MIRIAQVSRRYGQALILKGIDLEVQAGEIVCLLGPSGCGKTTLLRLIAGLEPLDDGDILCDGQSIVPIPVHERHFGFMFQDFALFPHLSVADNIAFGLRMQRMADGEVKTRVGEALELVNLAGFERRDVARLSGGERQRVALARSLAPRPRFLMLDEPLGSLDAALRDDLTSDLRRIIKQLGITALYVTHDQREAFIVADRVAILNQGRIEQIDAPNTLYKAPKTVFAARFLGLENIIAAQRQDAEHAQTALGVFALAEAAPYVLLHPDGIEIDASIEVGVPVEVTEAIFLGGSHRIRGRYSSGQMLMFWSRNGDVPRPGDTVTLRIDPQAVVPLQA
ncbi:MAG: ABC transporter ATP-binding protein [Anaerolineae bacterium]|nr:ABC transporter ATP-binding protein [Anaerolineae bacterium]